MSKPQFQVNFESTWFFSHSPDEQTKIVIFQAKRRWRALLIPTALPTVKQYCCNRSFVAVIRFNACRFICRGAYLSAAQIRKQYNHLIQSSLYVTMKRKQLFWTRKRREKKQRKRKAMRTKLQSIQFGWVRKLFGGCVRRYSHCINSCPKKL